MHRSDIAKRHRMLGVRHADRWLQSDKLNIHVHLRQQTGCLRWRITGKKVRKLIAAILAHDKKGSSLVRLNFNTKMTGQYVYEFRV